MLLVQVNFYGQWAQVQVLDTKNEQLNLRKVDESLPLSLYLGVLGMPGETAFFGLHEATHFMKGRHRVLY